MELSMKDIEVATRGFSLDRLIGKGSHGCVYKGVLKGGEIIAVKKASMGLQLLQDNSKLDNEIEILSSLRSPYIVNLLGVSQDASMKVLITEFMPHGSLEYYLHNDSCPPSWFRRVVMAFQLARAVLALHESTPPVIHRDIKSANILLDSDWNARLADFGLAVRGNFVNGSPDLYSGISISSSSSGSSNSSDMSLNADMTIQSLAVPAGTIGYLDPCYTTPAHLSTKNDVFSFGVVLLEIVSSRRAMDTAFEPASIVDWALPLIENDQIRDVCDSRVALPSFMKGAIRRMLVVAIRCVSHKKERRPSMAEIVRELQAVVEWGQLSFWGLLRCSLLRRFSYLNLKRKQTTRTVVCKADEADLVGN
eukprot:TRINITY_DN43327_c0_g1_i1.p1 TRINITY_DN43327_c0_g1~~TRINITY_DN43327_c0_g1_i1.p1  ORF type:complete len:364 (+),score=54.54 TRINITY_DN43327_c0_g1_i1:156-1247(+)